MKDEPTARPAPVNEPPRGVVRSARDLAERAHASRRRNAGDCGTLHLTISRSRDARSRDANDVLQAGAGAPLEVTLRGVIAWSDD